MRVDLKNVCFEWIYIVHCILYISLSLSLSQVANPASELPEAAKHEVDPDHILGIVGIVGTFLNLLVVVLVYVYTPI